MDDPQKPVDDSKLAGVSVGLPPQPVVAPVAPVAPAPVSVPVSKKEGEPQPVSPAGFAESDKVAKEEGDEYWESYAREIEIEKEIAEIGGVEKIASGEVKLPEEVAKEMGIKPTVTAETPITAATEFSIKGVALDDSKLSTGLTKPTSSGFRWLVEWFIYQLLKAHYFVKKVKSSVQRSK